MGYNDIKCRPFAQNMINWRSLDDISTLYKAYRK